MRLRIADKLKGLGFQLLAAFWWLCEWAGDKLFGDAAFGWARSMLSPFADYPWADAAWTYGIPALLCGVGFYFFFRSDKSRPAEAAQPATPPNAPAEIGSATIMLELVRRAPPEMFPPSGEIYEFDFMPRLAFTGPRHGEPGEPIKWDHHLIDGFRIFGPRAAMRITVITAEPLLQVSFNIVAHFKEKIITENGSHSGETICTETFNFGFARILPEKPVDLWLHTQSLDCVFLDLPKDNVTYIDPATQRRVQARLVFQPFYGALSLISANQGEPLSPQ